MAKNNPWAAWVEAHPMDKDMAFKILKEISKILGDIRWVPAQGTLFGAVKHNDFVPWDTDIDLYIFEADLEPDARVLKKLHRANFDISTSYMPRGPAYTFKKKGIIVDVGTVRVGRKYASIPFWDKRAFFPAKYFDKLIPWKFRDLDILVPNHPQEFIKYLYKHWRHDKDFKGPNGIKFEFLYELPGKDARGAGHRPRGMNAMPLEFGRIISWNTYQKSLTIQSRNT